MSFFTPPKGTCSNATKKERLRPLPSTQVKPCQYKKRQIKMDCWHLCCNVSMKRVACQGTTITILHSTMRIRVQHIKSTPVVTSFMVWFNHARVIRGNSRLIVFSISRSVRVPKDDNKILCQQSNRTQEVFDPTT